MATAQLEKVKEDWLTCVICSDYYKDPCTLRCQHSFCQQCLTNYIKTKPEAIKSKTMCCPSCRQMTNVPNPSSPVEEWAGQLKPGIVLQGLMDTLQAGTTVTEAGHCCNVCEHLGETSAATFYCHDCEVSLCDRCRRSHLANPASRDHDVTDVSADVKFKRKRKVLCREHKDEYIKFHCNDCRKSACQTCCTIYHRLCESLVTIESMKSVITSSLWKKKNALFEILNVKSLRIRATKNDIINTIQNQMKLKREIESVSQKAIGHIKQKEKELIKKLTEVTEKQTDQLQADVKTEETDMQAYQQHCQLLDQVLNSDCLMDMYDMYQACEYGADRDKDTRQMTHVVNFKHDTGRFQRMLDDIQLGEITTTYASVCGPISTIDGRIESDKKTPVLNYMTVLIADGVQAVVVTDENNRCVKSFYTINNKSCHSKLPLKDSPCGITYLEKNRVMVAVPESHQIVMAKVTPGLKLLSAMTTSNNYISLVALGPTSLAAGCVYPACVDILNMEGQVIKSVSTHNNEELFKRPCYMCITTKSNLLVSDWKTRSVICLTLEGDVVWTYTPTGKRALTEPVGITTTSGGEILLVDRIPNRVIQLTASGQYVRDVLSEQDGLLNTRDIHLYRPGRQGSLYVCEMNKIKVFPFTET